MSQEATIFRCLNFRQIVKNFHMSDVIGNEIMEQLKLSDHYSLMFDETTDCSVREQIILRAFYIDSSGNIKVKFLKIIDCLTDRITLDAQTVFGNVIQFIEDNELSYTCLRGIGTN